MMMKYEVRHVAIREVMTTYIVEALSEDEAEDVVWDCQAYGNTTPGYVSHSVASHIVADPDIDFVEEKIR